MQAALDHFSADEAGKDTQAAKEDSETNVIELDDSCEDARIFAHRGYLMGIEEQMNEDDDRGDEGEKVDPAGLPGEKVSAQLDARDATGLTTPQAPGLARQCLSEIRDRLLCHEALPSEPIRY